MRHDLSEIHVLLLRLGVTRTYKGFSQTACAVELCREEPERLELVTKWVYPEVAKRYGTNWKAVERNIRTVRGMIWERNQPLLEQLARAPLPEMPRPAQLLSILVSSPCPGPLAVYGLGKAVTLPGEDDDMRVMDKPVNEGRREAVVAKDGVPLAELQVGGDDKASALVAI